MNFCWNKVNEEITDYCADDVEQKCNRKVRTHDAENGGNCHESDVEILETFISNT